MAFGALLIGGGALPAMPVTGGQPDSLRFVLEAPALVAAGAPVPVVLRLTNVATHPVELHLLGREITFDVVVARADGTPVWRRLADAVLPAILQLKPLGPGETLEFREVWDQRDDAGAAVPPGEYTIQGLLPTDSEPLRSEPTRVRVAPR